MKTIISKIIAASKSMGFRATAFLIFRKVKLYFCRAKAKKDLFNKENYEIQKQTEFCQKIKISILTPLYNTPEKFLREMIESVIAQSYAEWELCLCDASDSKHDYVEKICAEYVCNDRRVLYKKLVNNNGISENTNSCINLATGEYFALLDHDDVLHPCALFEAARVINERKADLIYTDEAKFRNNIGDFFDPAYKPDFAKDDLRAHNYICHLTIFSRKLLETVGSYNQAMDGSQDHDMVLRLSENAQKIVHIPKILYFWRAHGGSVSTGIGVKPYATEAAIHAVYNQLERQREYGSVETVPPYPSLYKVNYLISGSPKISVVVYGESSDSDFIRCISSIEKNTTYFPVELVIIRQNNPESFKDVAVKLPTVKPYQIIYYDDQRELSVLLNNAVEQCSGDYIFFLHAATVLQSGDWAVELLMYAQRGDVGAVGIKLSDKREKIYSAGIALVNDRHSCLHHMHRGVPVSDQGYEAALMHTRNVSMLAGTGIMASRKKMIALGGFREDMGPFLFADLCLRFRKNNLLNVWLPFVSAVYSGKDPTKNAKVEDFSSTWNKEIDTADPYYNPNIKRERIF